MKIVSLPHNHPQSLALYEELDLHSETFGFNTRKLDASPFLFILQDDHDNYLGGIQGSISGGWLDIYSLYSISKQKGTGTALMNYIENHAIENNCKGIKLVTYIFQAPDFYKKRGYVTYGQVPDLVNGYDIIFMKKIF